MRAIRLVLVLLLCAASVSAGCTKRKRQLIPPVPTTGDQQARQRFLELKTRFERDRASPTSELEEIVRDYPDDPIIPHALLYAGMSAVREGDYEGAVADLEKLAGEPGADPKILLRGKLYRGIALGYLGRHAEALPLLRDAKKGIDESDHDEMAEWLAAMAESSAASGQAIDAILYYDDWYDLGRPSERAYALARLEALSATLDDAGVESAWERLSDRDGPAAAILGARVASKLEAGGDREGAEEIREETEKARAAIGMLTEEPSAEAGDPNRVGAVLPLTGRRNRPGDLAMRGLSLAAGSFGGGGRGVALSGVPRPFSLAVRDSASRAGAAAEAVDSLAADGVIAMVGPMDVDAVDRASERAARLGLPMVSLSPRAAAFAGAESRFVFHAVHSAEERARALARYAGDHKIRDFAIFRPDNAYGRAVGAAFRTEVQRLGGAVVVEVAYDPGATSLGDYVKRLRKPWQAVFVPDQAHHLALVAPALARANLMSTPVEERTAHHRRGPRQILLLSTAEVVGEWYLRQAGRYSWGAVFAPGFYPDRNDARIGPFVDAYFGAFGRTPTAFDAYAYDAALAIRAAVEAGAQSRDALATALAGSRVEGLTGSVSFDSSRRRADPGVLYRVEKLPTGSYELRAMRSGSPAPSN